MKKKIRMYEDAKYQAERRGIECPDGYVDGFASSSDFWGKEVEVTKAQYGENLFVHSVGSFNNYFSAWVFEDTGDSSLQDDMFRYGKILTDEQDLQDIKEHDGLIRIITIVYNHKIYYIKKVNGEIEVLKELKT